MKIKPIKHFENSYLITEEGTVISTQTGFERKGVIAGKYLKVKLEKPNKVSQKRIHRLVAEAFIPNPTNLPMVNHMDGNTLNNHVQNLEWCTAQYNVIDGLKRNGNNKPSSVYALERIKNLIKYLAPSEIKSLIAHAKTIHKIR